MSAVFYIGDAIETMNKLPAGSVDLILTSPPFLALRSYLPADHELKGKEGGSQSTPGEFIDWLIDFAEASARVLAPHGSFCVELGDTYSASGGAGGDYDKDGLREGQPQFRRLHPDKDKFDPKDAHDRPPRYNRNENGGTGWPLAKSLSLIPELFRLSLVYGFNPLTGRTTDRWRLRNVVRWVRPNPPVGALGDKFRPATSELMVFCKSAKRYFDLDSVRSGPDTAGVTNGAPLGAATVRGEHSGTLLTDDGPKVARWRCDFRKAEIPVVLPVARLTDDFEVVELVGVQVGIEQAERSYVVDLQAVRGSAASPAAVAVAVERSLPGFLPVGAAVVDTPTPVGGAVLASPVGRTPDPVALKVAKVVGVYGRLVAPDRLAARITLDVEGTLCVALLIAPVTTPHIVEPNGRVGQNLEMAGAPPLDWWQIPPGGYPGSHYATFPEELCVRPVKAMSPGKVCRVCGEPSRRIVEQSAEYREARDTINAGQTTSRSGREGPARGGGGIGFGGGASSLISNGKLSAAGETTGWTDCGHDSWRPGMVCDPFAGSGTTLAVATGHGRDAIGIDLDSRNFDLALGRVGPFMLTLGNIDETLDI